MPDQIATRPETAIDLEPKRPYCRPRLSKLGSLAELTQSNQAGQNDSFFGTGGDQTGPQPQP